MGKPKESRGSELSAEVESVDRSEVGSSDGSLAELSGSSDELEFGDGVGELETRDLQKEA